MGKKTKSVFSFWTFSYLILDFWCDTGSFERLLKLNHLINLVGGEKPQLVYLLTNRHLKCDLSYPRGLETTGLICYNVPLSIV